MEDNVGFSKKSKRTGIGGYHCYCCGPTPKDRPAFRRMERARLKIEEQQEIKEYEMEYEDDNPQ